jgi:hypothetical protein
LLLNCGQTPRTFVAWRSVYAEEGCYKALGVEVESKAMLVRVRGRNRQRLAASQRLADAKSGQSRGAETFEGNGRFPTARHRRNESSQFLSMPFVLREEGPGPAVVIEIKPRFPKVIGNCGSRLAIHL